MSPPNILYIHSHDMGRYVQPYGHAISTPNIQGLAEEGVLFRRAFCAAPTCSPSRAALLTGQYAHEVGMIGLAHRGFELNDPTRYLAHVLRDSGYATALAGVQHVTKDVNRAGYDEVIKVESNHAEHVGPAAAEFLDGSPPQPFFLDVGFVETHRRFPEPGPEEDPRYCLPPPTLPDTPETRHDMAAYKASARRLDEGVGAVLEALERSGLAGETLVICTTDHGIAFPHMKCNLTDHGTGVMLIMRGPGGFASGKVDDAMVSHLDLYPTVCELTGIESPARLRGSSLLPLMRGEAQALHEELFAEVSYHAAYEPQRCVRTERWKYIRRYGGRERRVVPNCDRGPSKTYLEENGWDDQVQEQEMLYDLVFDPGESRNLAGSPGVGQVLEEMRERLGRWMRETDDPLLEGPVPLPAGITVRDPDVELPEQRSQPG
jgi:N-sulfoglucosamine sulfohydrolase